MVRVYHNLSMVGVYCRTQNTERRNAERRTQNDGQQYIALKIVIRAQPLSCLLQAMQTRKTFSIA